jgi:hypothetical protein
MSRTQKPKPESRRPRVRGGKAYSRWTGLQIQPYTDGIHTIKKYRIVGPLTPEEQEYLIENTDARPRMLRHRDELAQHQSSKNAVVRAHISTIKAIHAGRLARFLEPEPEFSLRQGEFELSDEQRAAHDARRRAVIETPQDMADLEECERLLSIIRLISKPRRNAQKTRKDRFHSILLSRYEALLRMYNREPHINELRQALVHAGAKVEQRRYRGGNEQQVLVVYDQSTGRQAGVILNTDRALRDSLRRAKDKRTPAAQKRLTS